MVEIGFGSKLKVTDFPLGVDAVHAIKLLAADLFLGTGPIADVVAVQNGVGRITRDHVFSSPSTAGAIVVGRSCNGRKERLSTEGQTFGGWQARDVPEMGTA
jgi:hypothetical protein